LRHSQRKRGATARLDLRNTAPVLDPTGQCSRMSAPAVYGFLGMSLDENRFSMTMPVTIKHEKRPRLLFYSVPCSGGDLSDCQPQISQKET